MSSAGQITPTLAGFTTWAQTSMGITPQILSTNSPWYQYAFWVAMQIVDVNWANVSSAIYTYKLVYPLGGSELINFAQDPQPPVPYKDGLPFFEWYRKQYNILGPLAGVVSSASDQGTSGNLEIPQAMKELTLLDLGRMKDPWGRLYLSYAQEQGSLWGLS